VPSVARPFNPGDPGDHTPGVPDEECNEWITPAASAVPPTFKILKDVALIGHLLSIILISVVSPD
jgi:hypothetical protein